MDDGDKVKILTAVCVILSVVLCIYAIAGYNLKKERDNYHAEVMERAVAYEELQAKLYAEVDARLRVQYENEWLWDLYYTQVTDYEGEYEYYE